MPLPSLISSSLSGVHWILQRVCFMSAFFVFVPLIFAQTNPGEQSPNSQNWRYVTSSSDGKIDFFSFRKSALGDFPEMWEKRVEAGNKEIHVSLKRYNCETGADRLLQITTYVDYEIISNDSYDDSEWSYYEPKTVGEALLIAACGKRNREWTYVGSTKDKVDHFLQLNSITKRPTGVKVWAKTSKNDEKKSIDLLEFNCAEGQIRYLQSTKYSGDNFTSIRTGSWGYVVPESIGEQLMKAACRAVSRVAPKKSRLK